MWKMVPNIFGEFVNDFAYLEGLITSSLRKTLLMRWGHRVSHKMCRALYRLISTPLHVSPASAQVVRTHVSSKIVSLLLELMLPA